MSSVAEQFNSAEQQFDAGKLGMWLLIVTEVLFFGGLFCAYAVCRAVRPEVFVYAHYFLDTKLGALNTCLLLISSFTAALAVRSAQRAQKRKLLVCIAVTLACAVAFMVVKGVEYSGKYQRGLLPGARFNPTEQIWELDSFRRAHPRAAEYAEILRARARQSKPARAYPRADPDQIEPLLAAGVIGDKAEYRDFPSLPQNAHLFFGIYFFMTGLHGLHVLGGIVVWLWLLVRASGGVFGPSYFGPIDYAALYWHLVDLIWLYLFPLLYLIH
jgi:cytochrome c oxidase subunit III